MTKRKVIYLAGPYTSADAAGRKQRFDALTKAAASLIAEGNIVYSPITHTHPIDLLFVEGGIDLPSDFWCDFDETFMAVCSEMAILPLSGWESSSGVKRERAFFEARGLPVWFLPHPQSPPPREQTDVV